MRNGKAGVCIGNGKVIAKSIGDIKSACCQVKQWNKVIKALIYKARYY